ncbi:hypothetical protein [Clostridium folliculivorans]|uniref:Uncharacterized protein n=1 Tax=Clostridium folliculivorans TaxID=2886038 RepID=A0A9W5Y4T4_9CLOT|nr:hypothetical protein [Clostridium folliculivorans]GKU26457.1 hypothetical protein CFOLD11_32840 [Clostridium folliculivorans]GKU31988.1 hypothetical protein CFB3_40960 [Clostridium folliculivorans]
MLLAIEIIGVLCMVTIIFVAIWGFIIAKYAYSQIKYQNYLLEKLTQNIYLLVTKNKSLTEIIGETNTNTINENKKTDGEI